MNDETFMQALTAFEQAATVAGAEALNLCAIYKTVGPILKGIIPFIAVLPGFGTAAAAALTALTTVLDGVCHGQSTQFASAGAGDQEFLQAVQAFQTRTGGSAVGQSGLTGPQALDVCGTWRQVGPILKGLIPAIKKIPVIGSRIAAALQALAAALDSLCPPSASPKTN